MITRHWGFRVYGLPKPKGSMKCIGARGTRKHVLVEQVDDGGWRQQVAAMARRCVEERADPQQPIHVEITFTIPRPKSHFGTGANARKVKLGAQVWPSTHGTGDKDKLERLVLDALQDAGVLVNDAQVVSGFTEKQYDAPHPGQEPWTRGGDVLDRPGATVRIRPLGLA
jgi:crossover junction endodeoxyribonuclease RusA